jgi:hypothetical protein
MSSASLEGKKIAKALQRETRVGYFKTHIKEQFQEAINPLLKGKMVFFDECFDLLLLFIFTHIDLLGCLYKGKTSSGNAVEFMREYLGRVDERYKEVSGLLYDGLRHGLVHLATPKRIQLQNGTTLDFSFRFAEKQQNHLKVAKKEEMERMGRINICRLSVNLYILYEDLLSAMDKYAEDIRHNQELSDIFWEAFETRRKPERAKEEELLSRAYIQQSDFDFVRRQISNL